MIIIRISNYKTQNIELDVCCKTAPNHCSLTLRPEIPHVALSILGVWALYCAESHYHRQGGLGADLDPMARSSVILNALRIENR